MSHGIYISYPFCSQKCTYCNFASGVFPKELEAEYLACLRQELEIASWDRVPDTVYLGGGTPSSLTAEELQTILERVPGKPWVEATIEVAPGTITPEKVDGWIRAGINRVSLGVQSFSRPELARTGRKHSPEIVAREVEILRGAGISNINVDLIAGLPGQSLPSWNTSLSWLSAIDTPHVSVYMLEVDEDSRLGQEVLLNGKRYGAPDVPSDELVTEFYELAVQHLHTSGIERYEISNFARPGYQSLHNLKYWRLEPYTGFGADAHSHDGITRWQNVESARAYVQQMRTEGTAKTASNEARPEQEKFFVGLRLSEGVVPKPDEWRKRREPIRQFMEQGLLKREGDRLRLTDQGVLYSNEVFAEFIEA